MMRALRGIVVALTTVATSGAAQDRPTDQWLTNPVDRSTFDAYLEFFAYNVDAPFATVVSQTTTEEGVRREQLSFQSTPGTRVTAYFYHPSGMDLQTAPAVVFLHGGSGRGKNNAVRNNQFLSRAGIPVLGVDNPHYGELAGGFFTTFEERGKHEGCNKH